MNMNQILTIGALMLGLTGVSWGHIDTLKFNDTAVVIVQQPAFTKGGQVFKTGQMVTIGWTVYIAHLDGPTRISSSTNGTTWSLIASQAASTNSRGRKSYQWVVPSLPSSSVKIRIYQAHDSTNNPAKNVSDDYNLVSQNFTIQPVVSILPHLEERVFSAYQRHGVLFLNFQKRESLFHAELFALDGTLLRSAYFPASGSANFALPIGGLPPGKAILHLEPKGQAPVNQVIVIRP